MIKECATCLYCQWDLLHHGYVCENEDSRFYGVDINDWLDGICDKYKAESEEDDNT